MSQSERRPSHDDYEIAILCAKAAEAEPVIALFDQDWEKNHARYGKAKRDENEYRFGRMGSHNVVLAFAPDLGKSNAASVVRSLDLTFKEISLLLVVGTCGGVPDGQKPDQRTRPFLGDVVISTQVVEHDFGTQNDDQFRWTDHNTFSGATRSMRNFLAPLKGRLGIQGLEDDIFTNLEFLFENPDFSESRYPGEWEDILFNASYLHKHREPDCTTCANDKAEICDEARRSPCVELCYHPEQVSLDHTTRAIRDPEFVSRKPTEGGRPRVHLGWIASGDRVMKSGLHRDAIMREIAVRYDRHEQRIIAFEMEAAGVWDQPYNIMVIKGVSDYSDGHKNDRFENYAAATAAACMKAIVNKWRPTKREQPERSMSDPVDPPTNQSFDQRSRPALLAPPFREGVFSTQGGGPSTRTSPTNVIRIKNAWQIIKQGDKDGEKMKENLDRAVKDLQEIRPSIPSEGPDSQHLLWSLMAAERQLSCHINFNVSEKLNHIRESKKYIKELQQQAQSLNEARRIYLDLELDIIRGREACLELREQSDIVGVRRHRPLIDRINSNLESLKRVDPNKYQEVVEVTHKWRDSIAQELGI